MSNINIFRAKRGEGKTRWLFDNAFKVRKDVDALYYIGSEETFKDFAYTWESNLHEKCPIIRLCRGIAINEPCSFFTDEMMRNLKEVSDWSDIVKRTKGNWYITMSEENFIN